MALFGLVFLVVALILIGVRAFLLQCGVLAGVPAGILCAWLAHAFFEAYGDGWPVFVYGALGGVLGGVIIALLLAFIYGRLHSWTAAKLALARGGRISVHQV